jgi:hypothetical protein
MRATFGHCLPHCIHVGRIIVIFASCHCSLVLLLCCFRGRGCLKSLMRSLRVIVLHDFHAICVVASPSHGL